MRKPVLLLIFLLTFSAPAFACACAWEPTVKGSFEKATAIFTGKYVGWEYRKGIKSEFMDQRLEWLGKERDYEVLGHKFEAGSWWKGVFSREVVLISDQTRAADGTVTVSDCDLGFEEGKEYLIYAYGEDDNFGTGYCTRTRNIKRAARDIRELNLLSPTRRPLMTY